MHFIIILQNCARVLEAVSFLQVSPHKPLHALLLSSVQAICPTISLELIILIRNKASHFAVFSSLLLLSLY